MAADERRVGKRPDQVTLRGHLEQAGDEAGLASDVASADVSNLPFPDHRHRFESSQCSSSRPEAAEAEPEVRRLDPNRSCLRRGRVVTGHVVGLAEAHPGGAPRMIELAVSVHELYRRQRLGYRLLSGVLALVAFERGADIAPRRKRKRSGWTDDFARSIRGQMRQP